MIGVLIQAAYWYKDRYWYNAGGTLLKHKSTRAQIEINVIETESTYLSRLTSYTRYMSPKRPSLPALANDSSVTNNCHESCRVQKEAFGVGQARVGVKGVKGGGDADGEGRQCETLSWRFHCLE
jgi:hypothetical protein